MATIRTALRVTIAFIGLGLAAGCSKTSPPPAAPPGSVSQPMAAHASAAGAATAQMATADGIVQETMDAGDYTYLRVKTTAGDIWAAASTVKVAVGDHVVVPLDSPMQNFHSAKLNRDFPLIYFAQSIGLNGAAPVAPSAPAAADVQVTAPIPAAPGGISVAQLWADRKTLAGKTVTLRGKVVKFNSQILGLDWTHIQDGSGDAKAGTNDITITSQPPSPGKVGDVVTVTGTVVLDKDFTAGYAYPVMLQNATVVVK